MDFFPLGYSLIQPEADFSLKWLVTKSISFGEMKLLRLKYVKSGVFLGEGETKIMNSFQEP